LGPPAGGALHVLRVLASSEATGTGAAARRARDGVLHRLDVAAATLGTGIDLPGLGHDHFVDRALSPSGRRWIVLTGPEDGGNRMLDLDSGETVALPASQATWLAGDRLAWVEAGDDRTFDLYVGAIGAERLVRSLPGRPWVWLEPSPDRERLLIFSRIAGEAKGGRFWVYEPETDSLLEVPVERDRWLGAVHWAGPDKLAVLEQGAVALVDLRDPAAPDYVIGSPRR
jgi:hypothetical protein